jgi:4-aminobutyrate aminotransferase
MINSQGIIQKKRDFFYPNSVHFYKNPPHIVSGKGKYLFDDAGCRYLDFFAGVTVVNCGHCNPEINARVQEQLQRLQHTSGIYLTAPVVELAEKLARVLPGDIQQMFFCCSGSVANDGALVLARLYTQKKGFISFEGGLPGRTGLTMSVTGIPMWRTDPFPDPDVHFAKGFMAGQGGQEAACEASLKSVEDILAKHGSEIAGCIVEPVQGNGGINIPVQNFFVRLKKLLDAHNVLLLFDEVQTAFGRTGYMFASEYFSVVPDIISFAKALGNGVPIAAFAARPHVAQNFTRPTASTLGGNPVSMAAGIAVLDYIETNKLCEKSQRLGACFLGRLEEMAKSCSMVRDVRGLGLMLGMTLDSAAHVDLVLEKMKDRGYIIGKNGMNREVLAFQPPLIIEESDIDELCSALDAVLKEVQG